MLSLTRFIHQIDEIDALYEELLSSYKALVESLERHAAGLGTELEEHRRNVRRVGSMIGDGRDRKTLERIRQELDEELKMHGRHLEQHLGSQEREVKEILGALAAVAEWMSTREQKYGPRFRGVARKLQALSASQNLAELRSRLADEVSQLEQYVGDMEEDTRHALARLESDVEEPRRRLEGGGRENQAGGDFASRAQAESDIQIRVRAGQRFCITRFAIDGFAALTTQQTTSFTQELTGQFGARLIQLLGRGHQIYHWGDGDLLLLTIGGLPEMAGRAAQAERHLSATYRLDGEPGKPLVTVRCRSGSAEYIRGESADRLLRRVEETMRSTG